MTGWDCKVRGDCWEWRLNVAETGIYQCAYCRRISVGGDAKRAALQAAGLMPLRQRWFPVGTAKSPK